MPGVVDWLIRRVNWGRQRWSTARDRRFHDALFTGQTYDPFSDSYPGYLTIRRFADLAALHVRPGEVVLDLGCGPGEITCELARRCPQSPFVGVDHSPAALSRGTQLASGLGLTNVRFEAHDLETYELSGRVGLVTMFDAFHHLLAPAAFVARIGRWCDRFFLIEPAGNRFGQWQKTLDADWLTDALRGVRDRLEYQFGLTAQTRGGSAPAPPAGTPTEHRYTLEEFSRLFDGYGLDVRGTIAGLERYGTSPYATSAFRDDIGRTVYTLVVGLEDALCRADLDLAAKHWAVYAERGLSRPLRQVPAAQRRSVESPLAGAYDAGYDRFEGPGTVNAGAVVSATVHVANRSWRVWDGSGEQPVLVSYHWLDARGGMVVEDGLRSPLPRPVAPGEGAVTALRIQCPDRPGRYTLAIDLVHEGVTWFSRAGVPPLRVAVRVV